MMSSPFCDYTAKTRVEMRRGVVIDFKKLSRSSLEAMKSDLKLSATLTELLHWQKEYSSADKAPPTLDEIYFLDGLAHTNHRSGTFWALSRVYLDDSDAIRTYRDLIGKAEFLRLYKKDVPPSLGELFSVLPKMLERSGRFADFGSTVFSSRYNTAATLAALGYSVTEESPSLPIRSFEPPTKEFPTYRGQAIAGDALVLVLPEDLSHLSKDNYDLFLKSISEFAGTDTYRNRVHAAVGVGDDGLALAFTRLSSAFYVELNRLPTMSDGGELYDLVYAEIGSLLVALPQDCVVAFITDAKQFGLRAVQVARAVNGTRCTVRKEGHSPFTFRTEFLKELAEIHLPLISLGAHPAPGVPTAFADEISVSNAQIREQLASCASWQSSSYLSAVYATTLVILNAVLAGIPIHQLSAFETHMLPQRVTSESLGELLDAYLGIYRVLAETAIPSELELIPYSADGHPMHHILCAPNQHTDSVIPSQFSANGSSIYLFALQKTESGLPDFKELRALFRLIERMKAEGTLHSAALGYNTSPMQLIRKMCTAYAVRYDSSASAGALCVPSDTIHIVLEASSAIEGAQCIGKTERIL